MACCAFHRIAFALLQKKAKDDGDFQTLVKIERLHYMPCPLSQMLLFRREAYVARIRACREMASVMLKAHALMLLGPFLWKHVKRFLQFYSDDHEAVFAALE